MELNQHASQDLINKPFKYVSTGMCFMEFPLSIACICRPPLGTPLVNMMARVGPFGRFGLALAARDGIYGLVLCI